MNGDNSQNTANVSEVAPLPSDAREIGKSNTSSLVDIIDVIAERVDPIIQLVRTFAETSLRTRQSDARFRMHMAWIAVVVVAIIVGLATLLTFTGKMDGATYGFLLGTIVGYALTFIRDATKPSQNAGNRQ